MKRMLGGGAAIVFFTFFPALAGEPWPSVPWESSLAGVTKAELPAKVAELIGSAPPSARSETADRVITSALKLDPPAAPAISAAAAKAAPDQAAYAAATAAKRQPKQSAAIARAVVVAVPTQVSNVVVAICRAVPKEYRNVVRSVTQAVPASSEQVLNAVAAVFPELEEEIEKAIKAAAGNPISADGVLDSATLAVSAKRGRSLPGFPTTSMARPPLLPLVGNASAVNSPGTASDPGGRNYATP